MLEMLDDEARRRLRDLLTIVAIVRDRKTQAIARAIPRVEAKIERLEVALTLRNQTHHFQAAMRQVMLFNLFE